MPPTPVTFDHLAVGVRSWAAGFRRFAGELGGQWSHGGDAGQFAPCQLLYQRGIKVELIAPGRDADGFMQRFIDKSGPGPHHLTFKVGSLDAALAGISALGISPLDGHTRLPFWQEAFLHPRQCGVGTLLQLAQFDDARMADFRRTPPPDEYPPGRAPAGGVAWVGVTVQSLPRARELFAGALRGEVTEHGDGWLRISWGPGRDLILRSPPAAPGGAALWPGDGLGVAHVLFGPAGVRVSDLEAGVSRARPMPFDEATAVPVWRCADPARKRTR